MNGLRIVIPAACLTASLIVTLGSARFVEAAPSIARAEPRSSSKSVSTPSAARRNEIEADWWKQEEVRRRPLPAQSPREDAAGGCDGVKDGGYGFHTGIDENPWWQVDLGGSKRLDRVVIYNRSEAPDRAATLRILLSDDGSRWTTAYRHDGTIFHGARDGKPLVAKTGAARGRFVRVMLPGSSYLHLDEVEAYETPDGPNIALHRPANQSSLSQWSVAKPEKASLGQSVIRETLRRGRLLAADLRRSGVDSRDTERELTRIESLLPEEPAAPISDATSRSLYLQARWAVRRLALSNPLLRFDRLLFVKRVPGSYSHMSDQNYGWWSRPGGGIYRVERFQNERPVVRSIATNLPEGSYLSPELSFDGKRVLFAFSRYYPHVAGLPDKLNKANLPEDAFYHLYEMNVDGSGLRRLTSGRYDDFDGRYLPSGDIVFLSTRRGQCLQCGEESAMATRTATLPDSYVRCGGDAYRPVAVYTLHTLSRDGSRIRTISPFENFEWTPAVAHDGRILYARWDYVDRDNMPYMSLWSMAPDGSQPEIVYGNHTGNPHGIFEARPIPNSRKLLFTASAHHSISGGSLTLLDPARGKDGPEVLTRLTPEVVFPETEGWPSSYYVTPYPLSERYMLTSWSPLPLRNEGGANQPNALGLYLYDAFGNLELIYRDPEISSMSPLPLRPRMKPPVYVKSAARDGAEGRMLLLNVYDGLPGVARGTIKRIRVVGVPAKTQPWMNAPSVGMTNDDPGKVVLGTAPVREDGSAHFRVPSGVNLFLQALDGDGVAVQTMRTVTTVQPGQTLSCAGCHEPRNTAPANRGPLAALEPPSRLTPGPDGSWPYRFDRLVGSVLESQCVKCHRPGGERAATDLTPGRAYETLVSFGSPSLREHVQSAYRRGHSKAGEGATATSPLLALLRSGHQGVRLSPESMERFVTWMDTYAQKQGSFSEEQERVLENLRTRWADLFEARPLPETASLSRRAAGSGDETAPLRTARTDAGGIGPARERDR